MSGGAAAVLPSSDKYTSGGRGAASGRGACPRRRDACARRVSVSDKCRGGGRIGTAGASVAVADAGSCRDGGLLPVSDKCLGGGRRGAANAALAPADAGPRRDGGFLLDSDKCRGGGWRGAGAASVAPRCGIVSGRELSAGSGQMPHSASALPTEPRLLLWDGGRSPSARSSASGTRRGCPWVSGPLFHRPDGWLCGATPMFCRRWGNASAEGVGPAPLFRAMARRRGGLVLPAGPSSGAGRAWERLRRKLRTIILVRFDLQSFLSSGHTSETAASQPQGPHFRTKSV